MYLDDHFVCSWIFFQTFHFLRWISFPILLCKCHDSASLQCLTSSFPEQHTLFCAVYLWPSQWCCPYFFFNTWIVCLTPCLKGNTPICVMLSVIIVILIAGAVWWLGGQYKNSFYLLGKYYSSAKIFPAYKWDAIAISEHFPVVEIFSVLPHILNFLHF